MDSRVGNAGISSNLPSSNDAIHALAPSFDLTPRQKRNDDDGGEGLYRVTRHVDSNLPLTSKTKLPKTQLML